MRAQWIGAAVVGAIIGIFTLAGTSYRQHREEEETRTLILGDIVLGKTIGGKLNSKEGQVLCFQAADAYRARYGASGSNVEGAQSAIDDQLFAEGRCTMLGDGAHFDMTADGRERFTTSHGSADLWASSY